MFTSVDIISSHSLCSQFNAQVEHPVPVELMVKGIIPPFAAGTLFRTGPSHHKISDGANGDFACSHWFDGFTRIYRFEMSATPEGSCKVMYSSRGQVDDLIDEVRKTGKMSGISFGQKKDPCETYFQKLKQTFEPSGLSKSAGMSNIGVTIAPNVAGMEEIITGDTMIKNLVTFTDNAIIKKLDPTTLEPMGVIDQTALHPELNGPLSSAHAHFDQATGDWFNYNLHFAPMPTYKIFRTNASSGKTDILATLRGPDVKAAYVHSFFVTKSYLVLAVWPAIFTKGGLGILWERNIVDAIAPFDSTKPTKFFVIDKLHGRGHIATFDGPAFFAFHSANAWEEVVSDNNVDLFLNVIQYPNSDVLHRFYYENLLSTSTKASEAVASKMPETKPKLVQYKLGGMQSKASSVQKGKKVELVKDIGGNMTGDLPTYNPKFTSKKNRFVYMLSDRGRSSFVDGIAKMDLETQQSILWEKRNHTPGEPIFVPRPESTDEDDGVILSVVLNGDSGLSYLLCLNPRDMTELGRAEVPAAVGFGFHGTHIPF